MTGAIDQKTLVLRLRTEANLRRDALSGAGCSTYTMGLREGIEAIVCLCCGLGSVNANDIEQRYCGFCHAFHSDWKIEV